MKKLITLSLSVFTLSTFAATQADLILKGIVNPVLEISIAPETQASNLDLSQAASNVKVGTITEKTNYHTGYKVLAKSVNNGKLVNTSSATSFVSYTLVYDDVPLTLTNVATQIFMSTKRGTYQKDLKISYNNPTNLAAGSHEDTVQFTIEAN